ncbi:hypothetical protein FQB35_09955 [Crassaminicella thermophila]|uniref:Uncharacterized protein n=1 Tax=Crassaminicella thermophila TaxID=2599308 RepID=A0A5C0SGU3_CRATE|nr:hypothetical protein [Crassaminicella thermophila]QEK12624.1 hypothetical protein FQB35_09955 [Crassaminicella thermophila]
MSNEEKILNLLEQMQKDISTLKEGQTHTNQRLDNIESEIKNLRTDVTSLKQGQQEIKDHLIELDTKNANRHLEIIDKLSDDIAFIKHKEFKNEEDIFKLKKNLQIIK